MFLHTGLAPQVAFQWEMLSGSKIQSLLPTNSLQFGTSLKK